MSSGGPAAGHAAVADALRAIDSWPVEHAAAAVVTPAGVLATHGAVTHRFALASVTKMVTAWAALVAVEEGVVALDEVVESNGATLRHLLSHASGYPFEGQRPIARPGSRRIYSNTGFELLAGVVAQASGIEFGQYLAEAVIHPLGLDAELRGSPAHALHATLQGFLPFVAELMRPRLVSPSTAAEATSVQFPDLDGVLPAIGTFRPCPWGLGVEIKGAKAPHWMAPRCSPPTFGHFGGAGTLCWVEPEGEIALVAFTDRTFTEWRSEALALWPALGDAVIGAVEAA